MSKLSGRLKPAWTQNLPEWMYKKIPGVWRLKYQYYHEIEIPPQPPEPDDKIDFNTIPLLSNIDNTRYEYSSLDFRCPHCGQTHEFKYTYDQSNFTLKRLLPQDVLILEEDRMNGAVYTYESGTPEFQKHTGHIHYSMMTPCHKCKKSAIRARWADAYERSHLYFEAEHLCHCGGEMDYQPLMGSDRFALVCDRCGETDRTKTISGGVEKQ